MTAAPAGHNEMADRAETIRAIVAESEAAHLTAIEKALEAGHLLVAAKADCEHGEWLPFLKRAGMKERRARQYMQLAASGLKSATVADLGGIRGALEFLALKRKGVVAFDAALASIAAGGIGLDGLERVLSIMDDVAEIFPKEQRGPLLRFQPEEDAELIVARIADILLQGATRAA